MHIFGLVLLILLLTLSYLCSSGEGLVVTVANVLLVSSAASLYLYPTLCAAGHAVEIRNSVFKLNLLLGWTVVGWLVAYYRVLVFQIQGK